MLRKVAFVALVVLVLTAGIAGTAHAVPLDPSAPAGASLSDGVWDRLLDWLGRIMGGEDGLSSRTMDGCHIDPNGRCCLTVCS